MDRGRKETKPIKKTELVKKEKTKLEIKQEKERVISAFDRTFFITVLILLAFGTIMVFSASYAYASANRGDSYFFIKRQLIFAFIGICAMLAMSLIDYKIIKLASIPIFFVSLGLMLLVVFTSSGEEHKGASRWLGVGGLTFQPSEIFKLAIIILIADYVAHNYKKITGNWKQQIGYGFGFYMLIGGVVGLAFVLQDHLSGTIIGLAIVAFMMFIGGSNIFGIVGLASLAGLILRKIVPIVLKHSAERFDAWSDPFAMLHNKGWQPAQSLMAVASGEFWGVGFGASRQKQLYLPEPQNDYIFAILCEELGFIGAVSAICLILFLIYRGIKIALRAPDRFSSLLVAGIIFQVGFQTFLNICVVTNTLPSTGISLPFFSYGGTSLIILLAEMGIVLNVSRYSLVDK